MTAETAQGWADAAAAGGPLAEVMGVVQAQEAREGDRKPMGRLGLAVVAVGTAQHGQRRSFQLVQGGLAGSPKRKKRLAGRLTLVRAMAEVPAPAPTEQTATAGPVLVTSAPPPVTEQVPELVSGTTVAVSALPRYRRYTEALLRRYVRQAMEVGRAPALLGRELFGGRMTNSRAHTFEDRVIFVLDMERCLETLTETQQQVVARIALQEYSFIEAGDLLGWSTMSVLRRYGLALDRLTAVLLKRQLLQPLKTCQEGNVEQKLVSPSLQTASTPKDFGMA